MRILVVSPFPVDPPLHGSRVRAAGLARGLATAGADVVLVCPWHPGQRRERIGAGVTVRTHRLAANVLPAVVPARVASPLALLSLQPLALGPRRLLRKLGTFDVIQLELCAQAPWLELLPAATRVVYSAHNVERVYVAADARRSRLARLAARRLEHIERLAVERAELVITCSDHDAAALRELYGASRTLVIPNGSDESLEQAERSALRPRARAELGIADSDRVVLFVGGDADHNQVAVRLLADDVLPRLDPAVRLLVAGRAGVALGSRAGDHRVDALGFVDDLQPLLAAADIAVNPVASRCGSTMKLADFLAAGLPVVATAAGARGFEGSGVTIAPLDSFADALRAALSAAPVGRPPAPPTWNELGARLLEAYQRGPAPRPATVP